MSSEVASICGLFVYELTSVRGLGLKIKRLVEFSGLFVYNGKSSFFDKAYGRGFMNYLTMDFGGTLAKYSVMDENCQVLLREEAPAPKASADQYYDFVTDVYTRNKEKFDLQGIALSMPGVLDSDSGLLIGSGAYIPLHGHNVVNELRERVDVPVTMENDGKCGVLAEVWKGNLKDCTDGAVIILGTAVAGGIVKDRKVHKGKRFTAGELSFALVGIEDDMRSTAYYRCGVSPLLFNACMKKGIDVTKLPNHGLTKFSFIEDQKSFSEWNDRPEYAHGMNGLQFFELLEQGDPDITELYQQYLKDLARLVLNIQIFFDPDKILIGGGISRQERLVPDIRAALADLQEKVIMGYRFDTVIDVCYFMNEANQYGALYHFLEKKKQEESGK